MKPKAFIFDLNGTMVHDMEYHTKAWQHLFNHELGGNFTWEQVKPQMYGKNQEVLVRMFGPDRFTEDEMQRLSLAKEQRYQEEYLPHLQLLPGLTNFLEQAHQQQIPMAIGSAAIPFNIDFVLDTLHIRHYFTAVVSADDVTLSKPHPETFLKAAELLGVAPTDCLRSRRAWPLLFSPLRTQLATLRRFPTCYILRLITPTRLLRTYCKQLTHQLGGRAICVTLPPIAT
jgi:beta-phosphoglucomutase